MLLKSVFFISIILISWECSSASYVPGDFEKGFTGFVTEYGPLPMHRTIKPFLDSLKEELKEIYEIIDSKESEISKLYEMKANCDHQDALIEELKGHKAEFQVNNDLLKTTIEKLTHIIALSSKNETDVVSAGTSKNIESDVVTTKAYQYDLLDKYYLGFWDKQVKDEKSGEIEDTSCYSIDLVVTSGLTNVLCDSETAGPGWLVIQQRIDGKEDFLRDWNTYRSGFGSLDGDFFTGLERLHKLTNMNDYELYIHMESFNGSINYARYDNFKVASEDDGYKLSSLGEFSGNVTADMLRWHEDQPFSTFDHDNDSWTDVSCAVDCHGGWWYKACAASNLNGKYSDVEKTDGSTIYWADYVALKKVKMLIRRKNNGMALNI